MSIIFFRHYRDIAFLHRDDAHPSLLFANCSESGSESGSESASGSESGSASGSGSESESDEER